MQAHRVSGLNLKSTTFLELNLRLHYNHYFDFKIYAFMCPCVNCIWNHKEFSIKILKCCSWDPVTIYIVTWICIWFFLWGVSGQVCSVGESWPSGKGGGQAGMSNVWDVFIIFFQKTTLAARSFTLPISSSHRL